MGSTCLPAWLDGATLNAIESYPYRLIARQKCFHHLLLVVIAMPHGWNDLLHAHDGWSSLRSPADEVNSRMNRSTFQPL